MLISFATPWCPSVNHGYGTARTGRKYIKPAGVEYQRAVLETANRHQLKASEGRLTVWVEAWPPDRRKRDLDNLGKFFLDSLHKAGIIEDDALIDDLRFVRMPVVKGGLLRVFIYPFKPIESLENEIAKTQEA